MKSNLPRWIYVLFTAIAIFLLLPFWPIIRDICIQYNGHTETATVTEVPLTCKRKYNNVIKIDLAGKQYSYDISLSECRTGKYQVGQSVSVRLLPSFNRVIRVDDRADYMLAAYLGVLVILFFCLRYFWRWLRKVWR